MNHECLFAFLREKKQDMELDFNYLLELKDIRNAIDYRGVKVSPENWKQNKMKIQITINVLEDYVKKQLD